MLAAKDQYINEASKSIFQLSADEQIRKRCLDREEYYLDMKAYERTIAKKDAELADKEVELANRDAKIADKDALIQKLLTENESLRAAVNNM